ncbi:NADP-dependent oxidoreductase [Nocardia sp. NBC_01327]|uniref:NADP-dependent oxidoreductase n=1 Tax=Nocardia sp. NBC_01327 TaxID=2903593 RepID=UPI002E0D1F95|nr:NADP-dependent oxidoreductase [Nocardia sp. NBC_01327]
MRAIVVRSYGGPHALEMVECPVPEPGPGQVRVRVEAAAVNPVDAVTRSGALVEAGLMAARATTGIGWDVAGAVDALGPGVTDVVAGQRVAGLRDRLDLSLGAYADYLVLEATAIAALPPGLSSLAAATLPLSGLTAVQSLDLLDLPTGATILVTGAAGAVGGYAVQSAARRGLRVVAVAGAGDEQPVRDLGAHWFVPREADLAESVRRHVPGGVDGALDAAALGISALGAVRTRGRFVAVVGGAQPIPLRGITVMNQWIAADGAALSELVRAASQGQLSTRIAETLPLTEAVRAHQLLAKGGLRGRVVLIP